MTNAPVLSSQPKISETRQHTPTPWFVSGVRFRMNGGEWHSINRYDEANKRDENVACVGYDPRTGEGLADAHFIVEAVNSHARLTERCEQYKGQVKAGSDEIDALRAALKPFASAADGLWQLPDQFEVLLKIDATPFARVTVGEFRAARAALSPDGNSGVGK